MNPVAAAVHRRPAAGERTSPSGSASGRSRSSSLLAPSVVRTLRRPPRTQAGRSSSARSRTRVAVARDAPRDVARRTWSRSGCSPASPKRSSSSARRPPRRTWRPTTAAAKAASFFSLSLFSALAIGPVDRRDAPRPVRLRRRVARRCGRGRSRGARRAHASRHARRHAGAGERRRPADPPAALRPGFPSRARSGGSPRSTPFVPLYALELGLSGARTVLLANALTILLAPAVRRTDPRPVRPTERGAVRVDLQPGGTRGHGAVGGRARDCSSERSSSRIGQAFAFPALMTIAVNNAPATERGSVMGTFTAFFDLSFGGGAIALGARRERGRLQRRVPHRDGGRVDRDRFALPRAAAAESGRSPERGA